MMPLLFDMNYCVYHVLSQLLTPHPTIIMPFLLTTAALTLLNAFSTIDYEDDPEVVSLSLLSQISNVFKVSFIK